MEISRKKTAILGDWDEKWEILAWADLSRSKCERVRIDRVADGVVWIRIDVPDGYPCAIQITDRDFKALEAELRPRKVRARRVGQC